MKSSISKLIDKNKYAVEGIVYLSTPVGIVCIMIVFMLLESFGVIMYWSEFFHKKSEHYLTNVGYNYHEYNDIIVALSWCFGTFAALVVNLLIFILKLMGKHQASKICSILYLIIVFGTYKKFMNISFMGIENIDDIINLFFEIAPMLFILGFVSFGIHAFSEHLVLNILNSSFYRELHDNIYKTIGDIWNKEAHQHSKQSTKKEDRQPPVWIVNRNAS